MLAQNFKAADELGITEEQIEALIKTLVMLETGKLIQETVDAFRRALLAAPTVAYASGGESGVHVLGVLAQLGIAEAMKQKLRLYPAGGAVEAVARGEADLVVIGVAPIPYVPGVELVGWLPPELQSYIDFTGSIGAAAKQADAARTLLTSLTSPAAVDLFKARGFEPASR